MRLPLLAFVSAAGCGSSGELQKPPPDDHKLHDRSEVTADLARIRHDGRGVPLADLPGLAARIGLPVSGTADVAIDIRIPIAGGERDHRRAAGAIHLRCTSCTIGDDVAKLKPRVRSARTADFVGDGISFGHLTFDRLEARLEVKDGRATLARWVADSPDLTLELELDVSLASKLGRSAITGCVRFKDKPALAQRDPRMVNLLAMTAGGVAGPDGLHHISIAGTLDAPKRLGRVCGDPPPAPP
jgi:type II secretion system protein N